jgi:hypothetical protein
MDPIHPIIPHGPTIPPVGGSPRLAPLSRDGQRPPPRQPRRQDEPDPWDEEDEDEEDETEPSSSWDGIERRGAPREERDDDDQGPGLHIDISV